MWNSAKTPAPTCTAPTARRRKSGTAGFGAGAAGAGNGGGCGVSYVIPRTFDSSAQTYHNRPGDGAPFLQQGRAKCHGNETATSRFNALRQGRGLLYEGPSSRNGPPPRNRLRLAAALMGAVSLLALGACGAAGGTGDQPVKLEQPPAGQLPEGVTPTVYRVNLKTDPKADTFSGAVEIDVTLDKPHARIWLHSVD